MHPADEPIESREIWPPGTLIKGDFVIDRRLGGGGFGTVYLARNRFLGTTNVIKRLHEHFASDQEFVRKFVNEGRAMRRLRGCPHIVDIEQMTQTEDRHLILVMEYVPGGDLADLMESRKLSTDEVIEYARQIAVGLQVAHQAGLVHRDIKPQNVLVGKDSATGKPQLKLIDFGIAADQQSNHPTTVMRGGSIGYAAPEQWAKAGKDLDGRTDLYALGATMYRMLTGRMPYPDVSEIGPWIDRIKAGPPQPLRELRGDVPIELSQLVQELLAMRVEDRPADAGAVIGRLEVMKLPKAPLVVTHPETVSIPTVASSGSKNEPTRVESPRQADRGILKVPPVPKEGDEPPQRPGANRKPWIIGAAAGVLIATVGGWQYFSAASSATGRMIIVWPQSSESPWTNPKDGLKYVWIPPGTFKMGCSADDKECRAGENPAHDVQITKGFWLGQTEVTQAAHAKVTGKRPSNIKGDNLPVEQVNWDEAKQYCEAVGGRLPTEAEWEYAARGGSTAARYGSLDEVAWHGANSESKTHPVGLKTANGFGLYDMLGNVWEWTGDWYAGDYYQRGVSRDPQGPSSGEYRVLRGGSWDGPSSYVRSSNRLRYPPAGRTSGDGFRCVGEIRVP